VAQSLQGQEPRRSFIGQSLLPIDTCRAAKKINYLPSQDPYLLSTHYAHNWPVWAFLFLRFLSVVPLTWQLYTTYLDCFNLEFYVLGDDNETSSTLGGRLLPQSSDLYEVILIMIWVSRREVPVYYNKPISLVERRDSRLRRPVKAFSRRRDTFINYFDSKTALRHPKTAGSVYSVKMTTPQSSVPMNTSDLQRVYSIDLKERDLEIGVYELDEKAAPIDNLTLRDRLKHFTFAWYACTMSTGGIAFVLSVIPEASRFNGMTQLGTAIFVFNLFLFTAVTITICTRFALHPGTFTHSMTNPHEGFFMATFWLSCATMITNTTAYGIPNTGRWIFAALRIAFWVYTVCATLVAIFYYHVLFTVRKLDITNVLPGWVLPIFPAMLVGTLASAIGKTQPAHHAAPILVAGLAYQGLGMILAIAMYGIYFGRLMTSGLPADASRPAMFIALGPPSFTALALIGMAQDATVTKVFTDYLNLPGFIHPDIIPDILQLMALLFAIFLWMLSFWFFSIALVATIEALPRNDFHLNWYAYVFPNVGFTISTIKIGERLASPSIQTVGAGMGFTLFFVWIVIVGVHIKAVVQKNICWPGKDEDAHH